MKITKYKCDKCGMFTQYYADNIKPNPMIECPSCHGPSVRSFENITTEFDQEPATVSAAIETMKYAQSFTGKDKSVF